MPRMTILVAMLLLAGGCRSGVLERSVMTYEEAANRLQALVDDGLAAGLQGRPAPTAEPVRKGICTNREGVSTDEVQPVYEYLFPIDLLGEDPYSFVLKAQDYLLGQGLKITKDEDSAVKSRFATDENFGLEVFVNYKTGMALIGGTGPCVKAPK